VNSWFVQLAVLFADGGDNAAKAADNAQNQPSPMSPIFLSTLIAMGALFFFTWRNEKKRQAALQTQREGLKKNDKVITTAGIYAVVVGVDRDKDRVTLRVDEATGAKIEVVLAAIDRILGDESNEKTAK